MSNAVEKSIRLLGNRHGESHVVRQGKNGDSFDIRLTVRASVLATKQDVNEWATRTMNTYCQHSHDCCGHWYSNVWTHMTRRTKSREWSIVVNRSRNI